MRQRRARVRQRLDELRAFALRSDRRAREIVVSDGDEKIGRIEEGDPWPVADRPLVFSFEIDVPGHWTMEAAELQLDPGGEALIVVNGSPLGGSTPNHLSASLAGIVQPGSRIEVRAEAVPYGPFGRPIARPTFARARVRRHDPVVTRLVNRGEQVFEAAVVLARTRPGLARKLFDAVERALRSCPLPRSPAHAYRARVYEEFASNATPEGGDLRHLWERWSFDQHPEPLPAEVLRSIVDADERLEAEVRELHAEVGSEGRLAMVGHTHIDLAWLWPIAETRRKVVRSFATALRLMRQHPRFTFAQASPQLYAYLEQDAPQMLDEIRTRVAEGRWELLGGMWVEPDGNLPGGEAWVRQLLQGQRYYERTFGRRATVGWLPDTFGYAGNLPQLFRLAGLDAFFTTKLTWNDTNVFPHDLYWWEGIDGSRIVSHSFANPAGGYNGPATAESLVDTWSNVRDSGLHDASLYTFGFGDGGGGPTEEMLERIDAYHSFPGLPRTELTTVRAFFDRVPTEGLPTWTGEQYLEYHRGTYTSQARIKGSNRRLEGRLTEAEAAATVAHAIGAAPYPREALDAAWTVLLRNQFHDILPGSSIRSVNDEAEAELAHALDRTTAIRDASLASLSDLVDVGSSSGDAFVVWNLSMHDRPLDVRIPGGSSTSASVRTGDGAVVPHQIDGDDIVLSSDDVVVPGLGYLTLHHGTSETLVDADAGVTARGDQGFVQLENAYLRASVGDDGTIHRLYDKRARREVLEGRGNQLWAYTDIPGNFDAWELDSDYAADGLEIVPDGPPIIVASGPREAVIRVERTLGHSRIVQEYILGASSRSLRIRTSVHWRQRRTVLRALFPVAIRSHEAWFETSFGAVARPTHANTPWDAAKFEVPGHRWADISEGDYGVSLLSDAKYGYSARGGTLGLTLLRSTIFPDPMADEGRHEFTYGVHPHEGTWRNGTLREAHGLNGPLIACAASPGAQPRLPPTTARLFGRGDAPLELAALKLHEDGDRIVARFYEAHGTRGAARLEGLLRPRRLRSLDLLERPIGPFRDGDPVNHEPYGVITLECDIDEALDSAFAAGAPPRP